MFETVKQAEWLGRARGAMADYAALSRQIEQLEARRAAKLAEVIQAYTWPKNLPVPASRDTYGPARLDQHLFGEDLIGELAVANGSSTTTAEHLISDITSLTEQLPQCWNKVVSGQAPLWQARRVADACAGLPQDRWHLVDARVAPALGALGMARLGRLTNAAVKLADPDRVRDDAEQRSTRFCLIRPDREDPLAAFVYARIDRPAGIHLAATLNLLADTLAEAGDNAHLDERRARANPAAAVQLIGMPSLWNMKPHPDPTTITQIAKRLAPVFRRHTQLYVHVHADDLDDPDALARVETIGPVLLHQIGQLTISSHIRLTPVIHLGADTPAVDAYEIPWQIREHVLLRQGHDTFPYSSTESRHLDLDHTRAYLPGKPKQTSPANLGPLSRRAHRAKTHAGWQLDQPTPGTYLWHTPAGQHLQVDPTGTHRLPARE